LTIHEIFVSLQGETSASGRRCAFVRLTGCDLRCSWCDSEHAFTGGRKAEVAEVVSEVRELGVRFVTVTGGEPLLQADCPALVRALLDEGLEVQVETGGHRDVSVLDGRARVILDLKAPGSGEAAATDWENLDRLKPGAEVKLVLADRQDYEWAKELLAGRLADVPVEVLVQPVTGALDPAALAGWILEDGLEVRFTLQLHALLWPGRTGV
jgi:7-carboxy-7-deazaguanine synthase